MAEAFFGYLLPWGQMSYWGAQVIVNLFATIPFIGEDLGVWIRGDYTISDITLNRFFAFHVVAVPLVLLGLGRGAPDGAARDGLEQSRRHRDQAAAEGPGDRACRSTASTAIRTTRSRTWSASIVFLAVFSVIMFFVPEMGGYFLEANNFIPADPLKTPEHIAPVWYFTPYYAMLRAVPSVPRTRSSGACS